MKLYEVFDFEAICWAKILIGVSNFCGVSETKIRAKIDISMPVINLSEQVMALVYNCLLCIDSTYCFLKHSTGRALGF